MSSLENKNGEMEKQIDRQEQYSRRNYLLIHGIKQKRHKVTDELVIQTIKSKMNTDTNMKDIDVTHQVVAKKKPNVDLYLHSL